MSYAAIIARFRIYFDITLTVVRFQCTAGRFTLRLRFCGFCHKFHYIIEKMVLWAGILYLTASPSAAGESRLSGVEP